MHYFVRLAVLALMTALPLACGPAASRAGVCAFAHSHVLARSHVLIRAGHTTAWALAVAMRATVGAFRLAARGR